MKNLLIGLLVLGSISAFAQDKQPEEKAKRVQEEFEVLDIYLEMDESNYLFSSKSNKDGICKRLTEDENALAVTFTTEKLNSLTITEVEANPYYFAIVDSNGDLKKLKKTINTLGKGNYVSSIICSYEE